jgi:hypothetical protein
MEPSGPVKLPSTCQPASFAVAGETQRKGPEAGSGDPASLPDELIERFVQRRCAGSLLKRWRPEARESDQRVTPRRRIGLVVSGRGP